MDIRNIKVSKHALQRLFERAISLEDVADALAGAELVMSYPEDKPWPSRLVRGYVQGRPLHMVVSTDATDGKIVLITVYEPDPTEWDHDFTRRRTR